MVPRDGVPRRLAKAPTSITIRATAPSKLGGRACGARRRVACRALASAADAVTPRCGNGKTGCTTRPWTPIDSTRRENDESDRTRRVDPDSDPLVGRAVRERVRRGGAGPGQARRGNALGPLRDAVTAVVRPRRGRGRDHAVLGAVCPARRAREAAARQPHGPKPGRIVDGEPGPEDLRGQAARGAEVPQRRSLPRRARTVPL